MLALLEHCDLDRLKHLASRITYRGTG
jgi:hypothetical protein